MRANQYNTTVRDFVSLADALNRMFDAQPYDYRRNGGSNGSSEPQQTLRLPLDAYATEDAFVLTAYLPGVNPEDVEITFEGEELSLRGKFQPLPENVSFLKRELLHGAFERRLTFNAPVNADAIEATYEHGVLSLRVPKAEAIKPKQIKVQTR